MHSRFPTMNKYDLNFIKIALIIFFFSPILFMFMNRTEGIDLNEILVSILYIIILIIWILKEFLKNRNIIIKKLDLALLLILFFLFIDLLKVIFYHNSNINPWLHWSTFFFLFVYFPVSREFNSTRSINLLITLMIVAGGLFAIFELYNFFNIPYSLADISIPMESLKRTTYPFYLGVFALGLSKYILISKKKKIKIFFLIITSLMLLSSIAFARRTPIILIFLTVIFIIVFSARRNISMGLKAVIFILVMIFMIVYFTSLNEAYYQRLRIESIDRGLEQRGVRYEEAWNKAKRNPIFGITQDNTFTYYYKGRIEKGSVHSFYLYVFLYGGIIGLLSFSYLFYKSVRVALISRSKNESIYLRSYTEAILITILIIYISGLTSTRILQNETWILLGFLFGILSNLSPKILK